MIRAGSFWSITGGVAAPAPVQGMLMHRRRRRAYYYLWPLVAVLTRTV